MSTYPPAAQLPKPTFDFAKAFTFAFQDPDWVKKTLLGGLFYILSIFLVGAFIVSGYLAQLARNVAAGLERPLPEWDNIGGYLIEGLKLFLVTIVWFLPLLAIVLLAVVPAVMFENSELSGVGAGVFTCGIGLAVLLGFALAVFIPAALLLAVMRQRASAAFEFGTIFRFVRVNLMNYVLAIIVYLIANTLSQFGVALLCIGIFFTVFLSMVITTWAFAETYRLSPVK
jgi:hypothetical protein